jgi:hypothetical protein
MIHAQVGWAAGMNFYASREFLDAAATVHFAGRSTSIENVQIGDDVLRLLVVDGRPITQLLFLDCHQPLAPAEIEGPVRPGRYARAVVRGVIEAAAWQQSDFAHFGLAPFVDWSGFASFESYRQGLLSCHRGTVRDRERRWRGLAATHGELVFTANDPAADVLAAARRWKSRQLRLSGHPDCFDLPNTMPFLETLRERGSLVSSTLRVGGRLVSLWLGFIYNGSWSGWIFAYDPDFHRYSVGHRLVLGMLEESFARGHREFDFSEGAEDYKLIYATHGRLLGDIGRPPLARSAVVLAKHAFARVGLLQTVQGIKRQAAAAFARQAPVPERS